MSGRRPGTGSGWLIRRCSIRWWFLSLTALPTWLCRAGGADDLSVLWRLRDALDGLRGFPDVRVRPSFHPDCCHAVERGPQPPGGDNHTLRGQFYGYSEQAIESLLEELADCER